MRWMAKKLALNIKQEFHLWRYSTPREYASQTRRLARPTRLMDWPVTNIVVEIHVAHRAELA